MENFYSFFSIFIFFLYYLNHFFLFSFPLTFFSFFSASLNQINYSYATLLYFIFFFFLLGEKFSRKLNVKNFIFTSGSNASWTPTDYWVLVFAGSEHHIHQCLLAMKIVRAKLCMHASMSMNIYQLCASVCDVFVCNAGNAQKEAMIKLLSETMNKFVRFLQLFKKSFFCWYWTHKKVEKF